MRETAVMHARRHARKQAALRARAGYTLLELMIVVVIVGILAVLAIPAFSSYVQRSRMAEGFAFLGEVRQRQEAYRAEFGQYVSAPWHPQATPLTNGSVIGWTPTPPAWRQLGATPDGPTRFIYETSADVPGMTPSGCPAGLGASDFSYCVHAQIDLDGDGRVAWLETTSESSRIFIGDNGLTTYLAAGWE